MSQALGSCAGVSDIERQSETGMQSFAIDEFCSAVRKSSTRSGVGQEKMDQVSDKIGDVCLASWPTEQEGTSEWHKLGRGEAPLLTEGSLEP